MSEQAQDEYAVKTRKIKARLEMIEKHLESAEDYIARNVNVRSSSQFHLEDWNGKSGHPLWMKSHMVPRTKKARTKLEKALERIAAKEKDKTSQKRGSR